MKCVRNSYALPTRRLLLLIAILFSPWAAIWAEQGRPRLVVVVYPQNNDGSPGNFLVDQAIRSTFEAGSSERIEIYNEYLDVSRSLDDAGQRLQREYLREKYKRRKVDVVIAGLAPALDFVVNHREIFAQAPIVFCAVDYREIRARKLPPDVIGVPIEFDLQETLGLALRLHPDTRRVAVVAGSAPMDATWVNEARNAFRPYQDRLEFTYLTGLAMDDLLERVAQLPDDSLIYFVHVFRDATGRALVPAHVLEAVAERANAPIYGHVDTYVGRGIVGGRVISFESEGRNAARLALRVLGGESPQAIGIQAISPNAYVFDSRKLRRWGVAESSLPSGSIVRFNESSFWGSYKWHVLGVVSLCVVESTLIAGLLVQWARRKRVAESLRTSQRELRELSGSLIGAQESERRRIARELHDDFNQRLALVSIEMDVLRQKTPESASELRSRMDALSERMKQLSSSLHELSHQLHPLKLEQLGLVAAIRDLCNEVSATYGLRIEFTRDEVPTSIPPDTALCLYRIVQESLRNVTQYSEAKEASVTLQGAPDAIHLRITDPGVGFDPRSAVAKEGLGLISMRERLRLVGGEIAIASHPARGTQVNVRVPFRACDSGVPELQPASASV